MQEQEGVIKYHLIHQYHSALTFLDIKELNVWRTILHQLRLISQSDDKYGGLGYGNISRRLTPDSEEFVISGTQTGHIAELSLQHYAVIRAVHLQENHIESCGLCRPSSEALTHASVYQQNAKVQTVIHVHSPEIWQNTLNLHLPHTASNIPYGTQDMANAVATLFANGQLGTLGVFSMLGHEDGVVAFGTELNETAGLLINMLVKARCLADFA